MNVAIETHQLSKSFGRSSGWRRSATGQRTAAVAGVDLVVLEGEVFGLLGANGAGKTTLVKLLCSLILPDGGSATVAGYDLSQATKIRQSVGLIVSDERSFYWRLTARQNLAFFAAMHGLRGDQATARINRVLEVVDLLSVAEKQVSVLSAGMRQRLAIARGLLHRPRLLFLDEPSRSLDPVATARLHDLVRRLNSEQGVTIFLITHDLAEAEALCHRVAVMHVGQIQVVGQPEKMRRQFKTQTEYHIVVSGPTSGAEVALGHMLPELHSEPHDSLTRLSFSIHDGGPGIAVVLDTLREHGVRIEDIESRPPTLEEVFAYYAGQERQAP